MKAYVVVTARAGTAREIADAMAALPGVQMADACWGGGDVYAVVEFPEWKALNGLVLDKSAFDARRDSHGNARRR